MIKLVAKREWYPLRTAVVADDVTLSTFEHDNAVYIASKVDLSDDINSIAIAFHGLTNANDDCNYILWGRRRSNGPIEKLCAGAFILGTQAVTIDPITKEVTADLWADSITQTQAWIKTGIVSNNGNNQIAYLSLNVFGIKDVYLELDLDGGSVTADEISAIITGATS